jgi:hypothetical protein
VGLRDGLRVDLHGCSWDDEQKEQPLSAELCFGPARHRLSGRLLLGEEHGAIQVAGTFGFRDRRGRARLRLKFEGMHGELGTVAVDVESLPLAAARSLPEVSTLTGTLSLGAAPPRPVRLRHDLRRLIVLDGQGGWDPDL